MSRDSWLAFGAFAMLTAAAIGAHREGFQAAQPAVNNSSAVNNSTGVVVRDLTGSMVELLGPLVLVAGALIFLDIIR